MAKIRIKDDSGDKDFFTMIPNIVINHSSGIDQALYLQMKRFAGEDGKCFATTETLMKRLGVGRKAYKKSLKYLLDHKWVSFLGYTGGITRPIKTYGVNNIWSQNNDYYREYEKIPPERTVSFEKDTAQKNTKIPPERTVEEDLNTKKINTDFSKEKSECKELTYDTDVADSYKNDFHKKKKRPLSVKQKTFLGNSVLYQHFFTEARRLGLEVFEKESGGNAKMAKQAVNFLGIEKSKNLITQYLEDNDGKPISFKACLCEHNLVNFKSGRPISYDNKLIAEE